MPSRNRTVAAPEPAKPAGPPTPTEPHLLAGMDVWKGTCTDCHGPGFEDAPTLDSRTWQDRLKRAGTLEAFHQRAINGFISSAGNEMPPRGANEELSDEQVAQAVDYMLWANKELLATLNSPYPYSIKIFP